MKLQYKNYLIIKEKDKIKITNGIGEIEIDEGLLDILNKLNKGE